MKTLEILAYFFVCFNIALSSELGFKELKDIRADSYKEILEKQIGDIKILKKNENSLQSIIEPTSLIEKLGSYDKPEMTCRGRRGGFCGHRGGFGGHRHVCRPVHHRHVCRPVHHRHVCRPVHHRHVCRPVHHRHVCRPVHHRHVCRPVHH
ncbi:hypothetical protein AYI70_g10977, partial [Smittium culicis]